MLGIRYINKTAVDLWQGESNSFYCDLTCNNLLEGLQKACDSKLRHLSFVPTTDNSTSENAKKYFADMKDFFKRTNSEYPKRITVILDSNQAYFDFQAELFQSLKEG
jgi:hypothetical protein